MNSEWLNAIGVLLTGAIAGFMFFYVAKQKKSANAAKSPEVVDLEAKRDALIAKLREIDEVGGTSEERARLENEAADVLRRLDGIAPAAAPTKPARTVAPIARPATEGSSALAGFMWGIGSAAVVAGLIIFVVNQAKTRGNNEPASGGSGMQPATAQAQQQPPQNDAQLQSLIAAVQQSPENVAAHDDLIKAYMDRQRYNEAFDEATVALQHAPNDPTALTYQAIVRIAMGEAEPASKQLEAATKSDPKFTKAWIALAWSYLQTGRSSEAAKAIDSAVKQHPEEEAQLRDVFEKMKSQQKSQGAAPHPVMQGGNGEAQAAPAGDANGAVHITLKMANGVAVPPSGVIFLIAREGKSVGPPSAVKRIELGTFPVNVELTAADSMMGQPLPASMRVEVRIDTDGNAMTHEPGAPSASQDNVRLGQNVTLTLH